MQSQTSNSYDRVTFSLPSSMNSALDNLKNELSCSKSDIIKLVIEHFLKEKEKIKLQKAVDLMDDNIRANTTKWLSKKINNRPFSSSLTIKRETY